MEFVSLSMCRSVCFCQLVDRSGILVSACRSKGLSSVFTRSIRATPRVASQSREAIERVAGARW